MGRNIAWTRPARKRPREKVFTPEDGLVGRAVMSIAVDQQNGDVWVGTFGGLSLYSGGKFTNYTNLTSGLANDLVYGVALQGQFLWVATAAGVNRLDTYTGTWSIFNESNAPFEEPWAYGISVAKEKVYFAVWGGGILAYDLAQQTWKPYTDPDGEMEIVLYRNQGLIHNIVSSVAYNADTKTFWASTYFGLSGYDGRNWHNYLTKDSGLASNFINAVQVARRRRMVLHAERPQPTRHQDQHLDHLPAGIRKPGAEKS